MPTYNYKIDDKTYSSDQPLTEADLNELSSGATKEEPSRIAEALRKGLAGGVGRIAGAMEFLGGGQMPYAKEPMSFTSGYEKVEKPILKALGSTGAKPRSQIEQIGMSGIEALTDPATYLLPGGAGVKLFSGVGKPLFKASEGVIAGSGSEAGGIAGEKAGGTTGRVVGSLVGGVGGGVIAGQVPRITSTVAIPAVSKAKKLIEQARGLAPLDQVEIAAQKHIDRIFGAAATADPNFVDVFEEALKAQERTGIKMPLSAMMKDNPVINAYIGSLANKDPAFRKVYFEQFEEAKKSIGSKATKLFGDISDSDSIIGKSMSEKSNELVIAGKKVENKARLMADEARKLSSELKEVDPAEFGSRIVRVTDDAEKAAKSATSPLYRKAFEIGKAKGVNLSKESVEDIYGFVVGEKASDIFKTFPSIHGKVVARFKPKEVAGANLVDAAGKPLGSQTGKSFSAASLEDLDSLKKEINLQLRKTRTDSEIRILSELKDKVKTHIESLDPDFVSAYKSADAAYLKNVGLPFNEETIKSIERAKFDENIVPLLTKNKSTVSQFIDATGDSGKKLVEDAFISDLSKYAVKDGVLDKNKAKVWFASKREQLALLPDTKKNLEKLSSDVESLISRKKILEDSFDEATKTRILKSEGKSAQELVNKMYASQEFTNRFIKQYGHGNIPLENGAATNDAMKAIRSFMLDDIIKSGKPLEALNDRSRKNIYDAVFGKGYSGMVRDLALISDRLTKDPSAVAANLKDIDADMLTQMAGMRPERMYSLLVTNPVVSKQVAFLTIVNRYFNKQAGEIVERDMKKLLLDREGGIRILHAMKPDANGNIDMKKINSFAEWSKRKGYDWAKMLKEDVQAGAMRSYRGMNQEELQDYENTEGAE